MSHSALSSLSASTLNFNLGFPAPLTLQSQVTLNSGEQSIVFGFGASQRHGYTREYFK